MPRSLLALLLFVAAPALAQWEMIGPGVEYRLFTGFAAPFHVARVDLENPWIRVVSTQEADRGITTSDFARRVNAIVAVNGDYFTERLYPVGLAVGPCGQWRESCDRGEGVVAGDERGVEISPPAEVLQPTPDWIDTAVSGWPMVVRDCQSFTDRELPGSDRFTRTPHARTAVGLSRDGKTMYIVAAEGGEGRGVTLGQLSQFMQETLGVCSALNLDGGGSTVMVIDRRVVAKPRDGKERRVANHLAVVDIRNYPGCTEPIPRSRTAARKTARR